MASCSLVFMNFRQSGDYDDMYDATEEEVLPYFEKVRNFLDEMRKLITFQ